MNLLAFLSTSLLLLPLHTLASQSAQVPIPGATQAENTYVSRIHPSAAVWKKCIDVRGGELELRTLIQVYDCNGTPAQAWVYDGRTTHGTLLRVSGTPYCLDAGDPPFTNGKKVHLWECIHGIPAQIWRYDYTGRWYLGDSGYCLDLTDGKLDNGNQLQIWECNDGPNQKWIIDL
ncbi:hypothetical protein CC2G_001865 [Coprinopsis cinerea AmutBmut pab1-1]|nr:hypothetical protein CC2G_001865 [Coprinopsis cinerea AmutBmut pab1-1]